MSPLSQGTVLSRLSQRVAFSTPGCSFLLQCKPSPDKRGLKQAPPPSPLDFHHHRFWGTIPCLVTHTTNQDILLQKQEKQFVQLVDDAIKRAIGKSKVHTANRASQACIGLPPFQTMAGPWCLLAHPLPNPTCFNPRLMRHFSPFFFPKGCFSVRLLFLVSL